MKMSTACAALGRQARLAALSGVAAILVSVLVSACAGGSTPAAPTFSPGGTSSPTGTPTSTVDPHPAPSDTTTPPASPSPSASPSLAPSPTPSATPSPFPTVAPATGGGGTAGFQSRAAADRRRRSHPGRCRQPRLPQKGHQEPPVTRHRTGQRRRQSLRPGVTHARLHEW